MDQSQQVLSFFQRRSVFPRRSLFSPSGQGAGQTFGQQGVYNNMSITVSMAGGSGGAASLPPMAQAVSNSNLSSVIPVCSDQQVSHSQMNLLLIISIVVPRILVFHTWISADTDKSNITMLRFKRDYFKAIADSETIFFLRYKTNISSLNISRCQY